MTTRESIAKAPSGRPSRTPIGKRNVLTVNGKEAGYHYRVVNDTSDRVQDFLGAGYELVKASDIRVGDKRVESATAEGSVAQLSVGSGTKAFVMRIRQDWYDEDQAAKQKEVKASEAATKQKALDGTYGKLDIKRD